MKPYFEKDGITIYHGDCFDVLPALSGVGAIVTDPPYSSGGVFRGDRMNGTVAKYVTTGSAPAEYLSEFAGDNRDQRSFAAWCALWLNAGRHACVPGAVVASFIDWRQLPTMTDAIQAAGFVWRGVATWHKPGVRMQRGRFSGSSEFVAWGTLGSAIDHDGCPQNVYACKPVSEKEHIAEKPIEVMRWVLKAVPPGVTVLDPFMGSGTTLHAARDMGHRGIGIEADERYCEIAAKRLAQNLLPFEPPSPRRERGE